MTTLRWATVSRRCIQSLNQRPTSHDYTRLIDAGERAVLLDPRPLAARHTAAGTLGVMGTSAATRYWDPS